MAEASSTQNNRAEAQSAPAGPADDAAAPDATAPESPGQRLRGALAAARASAGPALGKTATAIGAHARQASGTARSFATGRLWPWMARTGWRIGQRLRPESLARDYRRALLALHKGVLDRPAEKLFFVPTRPHVPLSILHVPHPQRLTGHDYRPTPRLVFHWAMEALPEPVERFAFADYGAGRGRTLLLATHYPFETVRGVEIARELHDDCLMNISQYPRSLMKCRDVECMRAAAPSLPVPDQAAVFYFFKPFDRSVFERVLTGIVRAYKRAPRRCYLICVDMEDEDPLIADTGVFEAVRPHPLHRLKMFAFSPYPVTVYRSVN